MNGAIAISLLAGCGPKEPQATPTAKPAETSPAETPPATGTSTETPAAEPQSAAPAQPTDTEIKLASAEESTTAKAATEPGARTAFYRLSQGPAEIPAVLMTKEHAALCKVRIGDTMPDISSPQLSPSTIPQRLSRLIGAKATVVIFWKSDRRMSRELLADIGPDVIEPFGESGVAVVGIAVQESERDAQTALKSAGANFPTLLDEDGQDFASVGIEKLPRVYLLDPQGKILWFDIEYSPATRRELNQSLRAVTGIDGSPASAGR